MKDISGNYEQVHIIAEAGSNHNSSLNRAKELVSGASKAGADSVKFQIINSDYLYLPCYIKDGQEKPNTVYEQRKKEQLSDGVWKQIATYAKNFGIPFSASVFDEVGLNLLNELEPNYIKVSSSDLNNIPFLRKVAEPGLPVILSTGMASLSEIEKAVLIFEKESKVDLLTLLHCVSLYPCPLSETNLHMIDKLKCAFGTSVGFSDHTEGFEAASIAISKGASLVEKHFTTDKDLPGFDHKHALNCAELQGFVETLRSVETACRYSVNTLSSGEHITKERARRGLYASRDLPPGHTITSEDILVVRPSSELGPEHYDEIIGLKTSNKLFRYQPFSKECFVCTGSDNTRQAEAYWNQEMREKGL